jgi:tetraacyldisaccharide 4'-kinase
VVVRILKAGENKLIVRFLNAASIVFKTISFIHLKIKSIKQKKYDKIVVLSIDNLSFGGTGKTAMAVEVGGNLQAAGMPFAVVSRGYKSKHEKTGLAVEPHHRADEVGDEAKLLKTRFPGRDILIGKNRHESIKKAILAKNRVVILDDGFQSTGISKDIKVMLFNPRHPYYYLRNFKFLMKNEDYILFYDPQGKTGKNNTYHFEMENFYDINGNIVELKNFALFGFSALGDNRRFKKDLSAFNLIGFKSYQDHYAFTEKDIEYLNKRRKESQAAYLVCTEKDFVKLMDYNLDNTPLIYGKNVIKYNIDLTGIILKYAAKKKAD